MRVLLVALLLAGCGGTSATVSPTMSEEVVATDSPAPSAAESESPEPSAATGNGWRQFLTQQVSIGEEYEPLVNAMREATEGPIGSIEVRLGFAALEMMIWAEDQRSTLLENPPDPCYEEAWQTAVEFADSAYDFGDFSGDVASDPSDQMASSLALQSLDDATVSLGAMGDEIEAATC